VDDSFRFARALGFDFVEMSIDRPTRGWRGWTGRRRSARRCAPPSPNRRHRAEHVPLGPSAFPFGSHNPVIRSQAREIMRKPSNFRSDIACAPSSSRVYDVYYERATTGRGSVSSTDCAGR